jgi:tol-pal system protein YbgF
MKHGLKRLCGAGALLLPLSVWAQPAVDDLTDQSSNNFYNQTAARESGGNLALFNQLKDNQREIQQLRGQIEELRYQLEQQKQLSQERYLDLEKRLDTLASQRREAVDTDAAASVTEEAPATGDQDAQSGDQGRDAYQAAFQKVQAREFDAAIKAFEDFIGDYPNSSLRANAHYWLGELYSAQSQLDAAAKSFQTVIDDFPESNKMPDALYKLGLLKARQRRPDESRSLLDRVRSDYPESNAASMAEDFLNQSGN